MTNRLIITGEQYSGWDSVADWLGGEADKQAATVEQLADWKKNPDKNRRLLLVYASPEQALANALSADRDNLNRIDELMEAWERVSTALLDFFQRNRSSGILINVNCLEDNAKAVIEHCNTLTEKSCEPIGDNPQSTDHSLIAQAAALLPNRERLYRIYDEMQSAATVTGVDLTLAGNIQLRIKQLMQKAVEEAVPLEQVQNLRKENELLLLQLHQVQEELEKLFLENKKLEAKENDQIKALDQSLNLSERQIQKLQKELEDYFIKSRKLDAKLQHLGNTDLHRRPGQFAVAENAEIIGNYEADGYRDINIRLSDLLYSKGHRLESFTFKLILNDGQVGLEVRRKDNLDHADLLDWPEDMHDEYGQFLMFLPQPPEGLRERQESLRQTLSTHDRQLLTGVALALSDCCKRGALSTELEMGGHDIRFWRVKAAWLSSLMLSTAQHVSVERVSLVEDHRSEGYSQLWVTCQNLQFGQAVEPAYRFKVIITGDEHSLYYGLEFRNLEDGRPPLHAWPTDYQDAWGPVALVKMTPHGENTYLDSEHALPQHDQAFVSALAKKLPVIMSELAEQVERNEEWEKWRKELADIAGNDMHWGHPPQPRSRLARIPILRRFLKRQ